jgi:hypothetical protein
LGGPRQSRLVEPPRLAMAVGEGGDGRPRYQRPASLEFRRVETKGNDPAFNAGHSLNSAHEADGLSDILPVSHRASQNHFAACNLSLDRRACAALKVPLEGGADTYGDQLVPSLLFWIAPSQRSTAIGPCERGRKCLGHVVDVFYARWLETFIHLSRSRNLPAPPNLPASFEQAFEEGLCLVGSVSTVRDTLKKQVNEAGVTYVMCHLAFGDLPLAASLDTISAIQSKIMPAFASYNSPKANRNEA